LQPQFLNKMKRILSGLILLIIIVSCNETDS